MKFGELAVRFGFASKEQVIECLRIQVANKKASRMVPLGRIMILKGYLDQQCLEIILAHQNLIPVTCPLCSAVFNIQGGSPGMQVNCPKCHKSITVSISPDTPIPQTHLNDSPISPKTDIIGDSPPVIGKENWEKNPSLLFGKTLGSAQLMEVIGVGGMGVVYKGHHLFLAKPVAVKVLYASLSQDETFIKRFLHEARSASKLDHPNVVQILDVNVHEGIYFIIMQYVEGETLENRIQRCGPLSYCEATGIIADSARGLAEAHRHNIIHRDIKPANIMVSNEGRVKVTDFGLARSVSGQSRITLAGQVLGTPLYMSPEQCKGIEYDNRVDIYSLGLTYYAAITGRPPYIGAPLEIVAAQLKDYPPLPHEVRFDVPTCVTDIIWKMIKKEPDERYSTMEEVIEILEDLLIESQNEIQNTKEEIGHKTASSGIRRTPPRLRRSGIILQPPEKQNPDDFAEEEEDEDEEAYIWAQNMKKKRFTLTIVLTMIAIFLACVFVILLKMFIDKNSKNEGNKKESECIHSPLYAKQPKYKDGEHRLFYCTIKSTRMESVL